MKTQIILALASIVSLTAYAHNHENTFKPSHADPVATEGGLFRSSEYVTQHCGVGNYLFRHDVNCGKTTLTETDTIKETRSIAELPEAPALMQREDVVYFETNRADVTSTHEKELQEIVDYMHENPGTRIQISGYADATGTLTYNEKLAQRRAEEIHDFLVDSNIPEGRIAIVTPDRPVSDTPNNGPDRKVEMKVEQFLAE